MSLAATREATDGASPPVEGAAALLRTLLLLCFVLAFAAALQAADSYVAAYTYLAVLTVLGAAVTPAHIRPLFGFVAIAWLGGLANISSWRGYISIETLRLYGLCATAMVLPLSLLRRSSSLQRGTLELGAVGGFVVCAHLAIAYATTAYLYATLGPIALDQQLRFAIPPAFEYVVRSPLPLVMLAPLLFRREATRALVAGLSVLPTLLTGSRGSAIIALAGYLLASSQLAPQAVARGRLISLRTITIGALACAVVVGGFYLRRSNSTQLAAAAVVKDIYFDYDGWWVYVAMPVHLGFREPAGITNQLVEDGRTNELLSTPLVLADLATVLPGEQLAAGQALGRTIGSVEEGGLTPGLVGGLYIDFGVAAALGFLVLSGALAAIAVAGERSLRAAALLIVFEMQLLHLIHRGFLKPEYFTTIAIAVFYLGIAHHSRTKAQSP